MRNYFVALLLGIVVGCEPTQAPEPRADMLAKSLCRCTESLLVLNKNAENAPDSLSFQHIAQSFDKARNCARNLGIRPEELPVLETALKTCCPDLSLYPELLKELTIQ